jgi:uncharacterized membrane protein
MSEIKKTPPKVPPQRIPRKPETSYAAQQYSPGPPPPPAGAKNTNTLAIISLIASIIGILTLIMALCSWCLGLFPLMVNIAGAVMGFIAKKKIDESGGVQSGRKMAVIGMIMGLVGAVLSVVLIVLSIIFSGLMMLPAFLSDFY